MKKKRLTRVSPPATPWQPTPVRWKGKQIYTDKDVDTILHTLGKTDVDRNHFAVELSLIAHRFLIRKPIVKPVSRTKYLADLDEVIKMFRTILSLEQDRKALIADLVDLPVLLTKEEAETAYIGLQQGAFALSREAVKLRSEIMEHKPEHGGKPRGTARVPFFKRLVRDLLLLYRKYQFGPWIKEGPGARRIYRFTLAAIIPLKRSSGYDLDEHIYDAQGKQSKLNNMINDIRSTDL